MVETRADRPLILNLFGQANSLHHSTMSSSMSPMELSLPLSGISLRSRSNPGGNWMPRMLHSLVFLGGTRHRDMRPGIVIRKQEALGGIAQLPVIQTKPHSPWHVP